MPAQNNKRSVCFGWHRKVPAHFPWRIEKRNHVFAAAKTDELGSCGFVCGGAQRTPDRSSALHAWEIRVTAQKSFRLK
ncbi:hypothetical protein EBR66_01765 [bacterium]|nr:hypothetical protein [bacterium]